MSVCSKFYCLRWMKWDGWNEGENEQQQHRLPLRDTSFDLFKLFWIPVYFRRLQLSWLQPLVSAFIQRLWFDMYFILSPGGLFSPHAVLEVGAWSFVTRCWSGGGVSEGCFGRLWCAGVQTVTPLRKKKSQPLDHEDLTRNHYDEVWQLMSCESCHHTVRDWWKEEMIYEPRTTLQAGGWFEKRRDGCRNGGMDVEVWFCLMMAACHVSRQCFDNMSTAMASLCPVSVYFATCSSEGNEVNSTHTHTYIHTSAGCRGSR